MDDIVQIFKALGDETRLKILIMISRKRICAKGIAKHLDISEAAVSQHLKVLKEAGIILGEKSGYSVHYSIQKQEFAEAVEFINEIINDDRDLKCCNRLNVHIPDGCKAVCKANKNKCCQKTK